MVRFDLGEGGAIIFTQCESAGELSRVAMRVQANKAAPLLDLFFKFNSRGQNDQREECLRLNRIRNEEQTITDGQARRSRTKP